MFSCEFCDISKNTSGGCYWILMQLQDFNCIKHRRDMKTVSLNFISSHWKLFCKKGVVSCVFACEFEVLWIVQSRGALNKIRCSVQILPFCVRYWRDLDYHWTANSKHPRKLGVLVKIYIFSWDNIFLCGIYLLPEKMTHFFSILNKQLCSYPGLSGTLRCSFE